MSLIEVLKKWRTPLPPTIELIENAPVTLARARDKIEEIFKGIQPKSPQPADFIIIYNNVVEYFNAKRTLRGLHRCYIRQIPWLLFTYPTSNPGVLSRHDSFRNTYFDSIKETNSSRAVYALFFVFLREYPLKDLSTFDYWRGVLFDLLKDFESIRTNAARKRSELYSLLENGGPSKFSRLSVEKDNDPVNFWVEAGLTGELEGRGFSVAAFRELLKFVEKSLSNGRPEKSLIEKLFRLSTVQNNGQKKLRFSTEHRALVEALLHPFSKGKAHIENQNLIENFILEMIGDPRIEHDRWQGISNRAREEMESWLVKATLDVFFRILDKTADNIWQYRRSFWDSYYQKDYIRRAWAVLGKDAIAIAETFDNQKICYGKLSGQYQRNQSVLLLKISNLIIAEWSHNGKCRFWLESNSNIPNLCSNSTYDAYRLRQNADFEQVHHGSPNGRWQEKVAMFIKKHTNISMPFSQYMP